MAIKQRANSFEINKKRMINAVLEKQSKANTIDYLIHEGDIITDLIEILKTTDQIMTQ